MLIHIGECFLRGHDDFLVGKSVAVGAAVRVFPFVRDDRQVGVGFLQIVQQRAEHIGKHVIVGIHESDVFAFGKVEPGVAGRRQAGIALAHRTNAVVTIRPSIALFAGGIGGSVVDQYDFQSFVGLPDKTFHALVEIPFHVVDRHYHADEGWVETAIRPVFSSFSRTFAYEFRHKETGPLFDPVHWFGADDRHFDVRVMVGFQPYIEEDFADASGKSHFEDAV